MERLRAGSFALGPLALAAALFVLASQSRGWAQVPAAEPPPPPASRAITQKLLPIQEFLRKGDAKGAVPAAEEARRLSREGGDDPGLAFSTYLLARALDMSGPPERALAAWREAADAWRKVDYTPGQVDALSRVVLGLAEAQPDEAAAVLDKIDTACRNERTRPLAAATAAGAAADLANTRDLIEVADRLHRSSLRLRELHSPESLPVPGTLRVLAIMARKRSELAEATVLIHRARTMVERLAPNSALAARVHQEEGNILGAEGRFAEARTSLERAAAMLTTLGAQTGSGVLQVEPARVRMDTALVVVELGDPGTARELIEKSLSEFQRLDPGGSDEARAWMNLGYVSGTEGDYQRAEGEHAKALALAQKRQPESGDVARAYINLGAMASVRGDNRSATDFHRRAYEILSRRQPGSLDLAAVILNLGSAASRREDRAEAHRRYQEALAIYTRRAPASPGRAGCLLNLSLEERLAGNAEAAVENALFALKLYGFDPPSAGGPPVEYSMRAAHALDHLGAAHRVGNRLAEARDCHLRALATYQRVAPGSIREAYTRYYLGKTAEAAGRLADAEQHFTLAAAIHDRQRESIQSVEARAALLNLRENPFPALVRTQLAQRKLSAALVTLERTRARSLIELVAARSLSFDSQIPEALRQEQRTLDEERSRAYADLARVATAGRGASGNPPPAAPDSSEALRRKLLDLQRRQDELTHRISAAAPRAAELRRPSRLDYAGCVKALPAETLLLDYLVDEDTVFLFAMRRKGASAELTAHRLPFGRVRLEERVQEFRRAITERGAVLARGRSLYRDLVQPAEPFLRNAKRLLICPDGALHLLPFAALALPRGPLEKGETRYLGTERPLQVVLSLSLLSHTAKAPRASGNLSLLAMGDPTYATAPPALAPLPGTRREVQSLGRLFGIGAQVRLGDDATPAAFLKEAQRARLIHLACHGLLDTRDPLGSGLALTPGGGGDGVLRAWEIVQKAKLNADLVVLSACETGVGETTRGEGVVGLARALQYAGARSVVMSLWSVSDESTAAFMEAFYRALKAGVSKDEALRQAMTRVRREPRWRDPFFWAPFVLTGGSGNAA